MCHDDTATQPPKAAAVHDTDACDVRPPSSQDSGHATDSHQSCGASHADGAGTPTARGQEACFRCKGGKDGHHLDHCSTEGCTASFHATCANIVKCNPGEQVHCPFCTATDVAATQKREAARRKAATLRASTLPVTTLSRRLEQDVRPPP